ncbi:MAG TPA: polyprenyl synthetase family protein [Anaerolineae bacterium]|nr:polyprenyl synthetase family protein [Anaerolineae bacterium]
MDLRKYQDIFLPAVEKEMQKILSINLGKFSGALQEMLSYHLGWESGTVIKKLGKGGKCIRPLLVLLCTEGAGQNWESAIPAAAAVELAHNFSLIHDDIEDVSDIRRGRETIWKKWGVAQAINAGDTMYSIAYKAMLGLEDTCNKEITIEATNLLGDTFIKLTYGQYLDISFESREKISINEYWKIVEGKTAALFGCSTKLGAMIAYNKEVEQDKYYQFGFSIGMAFQVFDDWLGIWGQLEKTGKSIISDLVQGKKTLPVVLGMQNSKKFARRWKEGGISTREAKDLAEQLRKDGVEQKVLFTAKELNKKALINLEELKIKNDIEIVLEELMDSLLNRQ